MMRVISKAIGVAKSNSAIARSASFDKTVNLGSKLHLQGKCFLNSSSVGINLSQRTKQILQIPTTNDARSTIFTSDYFHPGELKFYCHTSDSVL